MDQRTDEELAEYDRTDGKDIGEHWANKKLAEANKLKAEQREKKEKEDAAPKFTVELGTTLPRPKKDSVLGKFIVALQANKHVITLQYPVLKWGDDHGSGHSVGDRTYAIRCMQKSMEKDKKKTDGLTQWNAEFYGSLFDKNDKVVGTGRVILVSCVSANPPDTVAVVDRIVQELEKNWKGSVAN